MINLLKGIQAELPQIFPLMSVLSLFSLLLEAQAHSALMYRGAGSGCLLKNFLKPQGFVTWGAEHPQPIEHQSTGRHSRAWQGWPKATWL